MYRFIIYSRRSKVRSEENQYTHLTSEWHIQNYLRTLDMQGIKYEVVDSVKEDISGGGYYMKRPLFSKVVKRCRDDKTLTLLVSKADRMSRNVRTGAELMETINFVLANAPDADDLQKQLEFMIAEREYKNTSDRWKDMYKAKKARCDRDGVKMEWGAGSAEYRRKENNPNKRRSTAAIQRAEKLRQPLESVIATLRTVGVKTTLKNVAEALTANQTPLPSGGIGCWKDSQVKRTVERLNISLI